MSETAFWLHLPVEIWRLIVRAATYPSDLISIREDSPERKLAQKYYATGLNDQNVFLSLPESTPPIDTASSLQTKLCLIQVSSAFRVLTSEFLYESLYFDSLNCANISNLANAHKTVGSYHRRAKHIYIRISQFFSDDWLNAVLFILRSSTPQGVIQVFGFDTPHLAKPARQMVDAIPPTVRHVEWLSPMVGGVALPDEILSLLLRAHGLSVLRITAPNIETVLSPHSDAMLPELRDLRIRGTFPVLHRAAFPSLRHLTWYPQYPPFARRGMPQGEAWFPELQSLTIELGTFQWWASQFFVLMNATPRLLELILLPYIPMTSQMAVAWTNISHPSLRCIELRICSHSSLNHHWTENVEPETMLRRQMLPFADRSRFPCLATFKLSGLQSLEFPSRISCDAWVHLARKVMSNFGSCGITTIVEGYT